MKQKEFSSSWDCYNRHSRKQCGFEEAVRRVEAIEAVKADVPLAEALELYMRKGGNIHGSRHKDSQKADSGL